MSIKYDNTTVWLQKSVLFALLGSAVRDHIANGQFTTADYYEELTSDEAIDIALQTVGDGWFVNPLTGRLCNTHNSPTAIAQRIKAAIRDNVSITDPNLRQDIMKLIDLTEKEYPNE